MSGLVFWFTTSAFVDGAEAQAEKVDDECAGHALAVWLSKALQSAGIDASAPWVEDHGWDFTIRDGDRKYLCVCNSGDGASPSRSAHVQIAPLQSLFDRLRGRNRFDAETDPVAKALETILRNSPEILDLRTEITPR